MFELLKAKDSKRRNFYIGGAISFVIGLLLFPLLIVAIVLSILSMREEKEIIRVINDYVTKNGISTEYKLPLFRTRFKKTPLSILKKSNTEEEFEREIIEFYKNEQ